MAILLTNGKYYIAHSRSGAVVKVKDVRKAQNFYSVDRAINQKNKTPGKCAGYYFIDTDRIAFTTDRKKNKRKNFFNKGTELDIPEDGRALLLVWRICPI